MLSDRQKLFAAAFGLTLAALLAAAAAHCGELRTDAAFAAVGVGLDLGTTEWKLRTCPACYERHPWGQSTGQRIALKVAGASAVMGAEVYLRRKGARRKATALRWIYLGINVGASALTLRAGRR